MKSKISRMENADKKVPENVLDFLEETKHVRAKIDITNDEIMDIIKWLNQKELRDKLKNINTVGPSLSIKINTLEGKNK